MIYLLYGADSFRSRAKLRQITEEYRKKHEGALDLFRFDAEIDSPGILEEAGKAQSLFQKKKLIIVEGAAKAGAKFESYLKRFLKEWKEDKDVVAFFWDEGSAKDLQSFIKKVEPHAAKTQEFKEMTSAEAARWLAEFVKEKNLKLDASQIRELLDRFSASTWQLATEAEKAALGGEMGRSLFLPEEKIWGFLDASLLEPQRALRALSRLASETDEYYLWASFIGHVRTLVMAADGELPSSVHPYAADKARRKVRALDPRKLEMLYEKLFYEDANTKTGVSTPFSVLTDIALSFETTH